MVFLLHLHASNRQLSISYFVVLFLVILFFSFIAMDKSGEHKYNRKENRKKNLKIICVLFDLVNLLEFSTIDTNFGESTDVVAEDILPVQPLSTHSKPNELTEKKIDTFNVIPRFYHKLPRNNDMLALKLREEARTLFLQKRSKELLDNNELKTLWNILQKNSTPPSINNEHFINYDDFLHVANVAGERFK